MAGGCLVIEHGLHEAVRGDGAQQVVTQLSEPDSPPVGLDLEPRALVRGQGDLERVDLRPLEWVGVAARQLARTVGGDVGPLTRPGPGTGAKAGSGRSVVSPAFLRSAW